MTLITTPDARELLRDAGLRVTGPRVAILETLADNPHSDADTVLHDVRESYGHVSTQAVYDALRSMSERGILRRIEPAGKSALYERRVGDNHHHLVCRTCAKIVDIPCVTGEAPCLTPVHESNESAGFVIDEAEVTFWGTCRECQALTAQPGHTSSQKFAGEPAL